MAVTGYNGTTYGGQRSLFFDRERNVLVMLTRLNKIMYVDMGASTKA